VTIAVETAWLSGSAFLAGAINSIAGGGTLLTYPALLAAGLSPIHANATSCLALVQGQLAGAWGFRKPLSGNEKLAALLGIPSLAGAIFGALILLWMSERSFKLVVPWLILGATLLFLLSDRLHTKWQHTPEQPPRLPLLLGLQLLVSIYGGFFGAGQSILMLAALGFSGLRDIDRMNGLKSVAGAVTNGVAAAIFIYGGLVEWRPAVIMSIAAIFGGFTGAHFSQRIGKQNARRAVVLVGFATTIVTFYKAFA
jgi:uncharacterized membrane protein YfcA